MYVDKGGANASAAADSPTADSLLEAVISVRDSRLRLSPEQIDKLLLAHPTLAEHACRQQGVGLFGDKIASASLPHLVEHLAIDKLVAAHGQAIAGTTTWQRRTALVRLRLPANLLSAAEAALRDAVAEINTLI